MVRHIDRSNTVEHSLILPILIFGFSRFLLQIFTRFGKVLKIVTFTKNSKYRFMEFSNFKI